MNIVSIYRKFPTEESCIAHLEAVKWKGRPVCPYCKSTKSTPLPKEFRHHCNTCNTTYSVTVGTIFHNTKLDLQKWFLGVTLMLNAKKGLSARQLARDLEVNKNTAWFMAMRIRKAMLDNGDLLRGIVEMDETYVGGKPRRGGRPGIRGRGTRKTPVVGMVERKGKIVARVSPLLTSKQLMTLIRRNVSTDSTLMTDEYCGYRRAHGHVKRHGIINHSKKQYVSGDIHTNTIEGFWSLLKRGIIGQYHKVSITHLQKYVDEFAFRYNNRKNIEVFNLTINNALGIVA
jgi:transposase-like protein